MRSRDVWTQLAIIAVGTWLGWVWGTISLTCQPSADNQGRYADYDQRISAPFATFGAGLTRQPRPANAADESNQDSDDAFWGCRLNWGTVPDWAIAAATCSGVILALKTLRAIKDEVDETKKAATATTEAATAATAQAKIAKESMEMLNRPYLRIDRVESHYPARLAGRFLHWHLDIRFQVSNYGLSPGRIDKIELIDPLLIPKTSVQTHTFGQMIPHGGSDNVTVWMTRLSEESAAEMGTEPGIRMDLKGAITYTDYFKNTHVLGFHYEGWVNQDHGAHLTQLPIEGANGERNWGLPIPSSWPDRGEHKVEQDHPKPEGEE